MAAEHIHIITTFVYPGGVAEKEIGGKRRMVRVGLGNVDCPERGLIAEFEKTIKPIPWETAEARKDAIDAIRDASWIIDERRRAELIRHVVMSQYFERKS